MSYDLVVLTTAVTRLSLHEKIFPEYIKFLEGLNIKWLFTINQILEEPIQPVQEYFLSLTSSNRDVEVIYTGPGGTRKAFYTSAQTLANFSYHIPTKYGFLWLEDDWKYTGEYKLLEVLREEISQFQDNDYIRLSHRKEKGVVLSFNPGLWGPSLFKEACYSPLQKAFHAKNHNPEDTCCTPIPEKKRMVGQFYSFPTFVDQGREWQKEAKIIRTFLVKE